MACKECMCQLCGDECECENCTSEQCDCGHKKSVKNACVKYAVTSANVKTALRSSVTADTRSLRITATVFCRRIVYMKKVPVGDFIGNEGEANVYDS